MHASAARLLLIAPFALALGGCSLADDEEETVEFPAFTGKRVIYVADSDGDDTSTFGDEIFVADTGSLTQTITPMGNAGAPAYFDQPGTAGSTGPLVARLVEDPSDGCPSNYRLVPSTGGPVESLFPDECVFAYASNPSGTRFVFLAEFDTTGTNLYVFDPTDPDDPSVLHQINVGTSGFPGTVNRFVVSADGDSLFWEDDTGVAYANLTVALDQIRFTASLVGPTDHPTTLYALGNGSGVIYAPVSTERYQFTTTTGSEFYITNALGAGDLLDRTADGARLSSNGATLLFVATIGGVKQLWVLTVGGPLAEARADTAATQILQTGYSFEFSPDGLSYAWLGDDGTGNTIFTAAVNSPTNIVTLTPATEEPTGTLHWADGSTVVYVSTDADQAVPVGASALRSVNTSSPLTTVAVGPDETGGYVVGAVSVCSDGTLAFAMSLPGATTTSAVYTADADTPAAAVQISPTISSTTAEVFQVNCVD